MKPLEPKVPPGSKVIINALYSSGDSAQLTDDLYLVKLPNGVRIDVGWFPECDPSGQYEICAYRDDFDDRVAGPFAARNAIEAVKMVEELAKSLLASAGTPPMPVETLPTEDPVA